MTPGFTKEKCQYCGDYGVALADEKGHPFLRGVIIVNVNPQIVKCPCGIEIDNGPTAQRD